MKLLSTEEKIERHLAFWGGEPLTRPLLSLRTGDYFFSRHFKANEKLLSMGHVVTPDQIDVDSYMADYERMYHEFESIGHDALFTAEPCTGFPWMECIFGAQAMGSSVSFVTHPVLEDVSQLKNLKLDKSNPWYVKYLEFSRKLQVLSKGRFSVSQPILRGVTDTIGALVGQEEMICGLMEEPDVMKEAFRVVANAQRELIADQYAVTERFHGGASFGFYHIWAPDKVIWYQEDLAALMSPIHYEQFLHACADQICEGYAYTLVHLHPASFFHLDGMLSVKNLKAVQINKDAVGFSVREMIPQCRKVIESGKKLLIGMGEINKDDIDAIYENLPNHSVALNAIVSDCNQARELVDYINGKQWQ